MHNLDSLLNLQLVPVAVVLPRWMKEIMESNCNLDTLQYCEKYIAQEFTLAGNPDCPSLLYIAYGEELANSAIVPVILKRHLTTKQLWF